MNRGKNTASGVAGTESGSGKYLTNDSSNFNRNQARKQGLVERNLHKGAENAITGSDLVKIIGCRSTRYLQTMISIERKNGALILSSSNGYFLPDDGEKGREEIQQFVSKFRSLEHCFGYAKEVCNYETHI